MCLFITVDKVTTEVAEFSDGTSFLRQRPNLKPELGITQILQPDTFKYVFVVGDSVEACLSRLGDSDKPLGGDGRGVGLTPKDKN